MPAPALFVAVPLLLGILIGSTRGDGLPFVVPALVVIWTLAAIATWRGSRTAVALTCAGCCGAGILLATDARRDAERPSILTWFAQHGASDRPVSLTGILREDAAGSGTAISLTLDATRAGGRTVDGGVRVTVAGALAPGAAPAWRAGRTLALDVQLREPLDYRDPGVPSDRSRLARQGIVLLGSTKSAALVSVVATGGVVSETAAALRAFVRRATASSVGDRKSVV